jgi:glycosyltransferase involved in cell wall biosynthesis
MKIALCSSYIPFVYGGARNIVEWLEAMLLKHGHQVEIVYIPELYNTETSFQQMMTYRWVNLDTADRIVCFRPQAHLIPHSHKILWFIHHIRQFYDLWATPYGFQDTLKNRTMRSALIATDNMAFKEAKAIYTNSKIISSRLKNFNDVRSEVLYPPVIQPERFHCAGYNDEVVYISRLEEHKRQHLLAEALKFTKTPVRVRICGTTNDANYTKKLEGIVDSDQTGDRLKIDNRWISEEEKVKILSDCLAAAYLPHDEDSYGYPSVEASHASKCILTTSDSGGVIELVENGQNGYVSQPTPQALAECLDKLYLDRQVTSKMGEKATEYLAKLNISWDHVVEKLTQ